MVHRAEWATRTVSHHPGEECGVCGDDIWSEDDRGIFEGRFALLTICERCARAAHERAERRRLVGLARLATLAKRRAR